jgi:hypothetical protein
MRRIKLILAAATAMAVLMVMTAAPALAQGVCANNICTGAFELSGSGGSQQGFTQGSGSGGDISFGGGGGGSSSGSSGGSQNQQGVVQQGVTGGDIDLEG